MLVLEFFSRALSNIQTLCTPSSASWLNEPPHWLTVLRTFPIKPNETVLPPPSPYCAGSNQIKMLISISEMDEMGGKRFALWKITAPSDGAGILDEMSQPITMAILHHFCTQQIAVTTFKCWALMIKSSGWLKSKGGLIAKCEFGEDFFFPLFHHKITFPLHSNMVVIAFVWIIYLPIYPQTISWGYGDALLAVSLQ